MKRRIILLIIITIFITGCNATYTLTLDEEKINTELHISNKDKSTWDNFKLYRDGKEPVGNSMYLYETARNDKDDELSVVYSEETMPFNNFQHSLSIAYYVVELSGEANYTYDDEKITFEFNKLNTIYDKYPSFNNFTIKFKTNHEVISHNADEVKNNNYYFYITKENAINKQIKLEISRDYNNNIKIEEPEQQEKIFMKDEEGYFNNKSLIVFYVLLGILGVIAIIIIMIKVINSNR